MTGKEKPTEVGRSELISVMNYKTSGTDQQGPSAAGRAALDAQKELNKEFEAIGQEIAQLVFNADTPQNLARTFAENALKNVDKDSAFKTGKTALINLITEKVKEKYRNDGRESELEGFKFGASELNAIWKELRANDQSDQEEIDPQNLPLHEREIEPWEEKVDPEELLNELTETFKTFVTFAEGVQNQQAQVCALYTLLTYCQDYFNAVPYISITAPEKGCGKSTLLEVFSYLVKKPYVSANASASVVFRTIDKHRPTLLLDEVDMFLKDSDLVGILNSGYKRRLAYVGRIEKINEEYQVMNFFVFGCKIYAGIGAKNVSDTLTDRSIIIEIQKQLEAEQKPWIDSYPQEKFEVLCRKCARFAEDAKERLQEHQMPDFPKGLINRAREKFAALFRIADYIDEQTGITDIRNYGASIRDAALTLSTVETERPFTNELLDNIREVFDTTGYKSISAKELLQKLLANPEWRWSEFNYNNPITLSWLGSTIGKNWAKSKKVEGVKRFYRKDLESAFERYLKPVECEEVSDMNTYREPPPF